MRRFNYKAKEKTSGKTAKGVIQAEDEQTAGHLLIDQGYIPISISEEGTGLFGSKGRVTSKDRVTFTRQLSTLIAAGLPIAASLRTVAEQTQSHAMKVVAEEILTNVEAGKTLHAAFSQYPEIFNGVYLGLIKAGEVSGTLDMALKRLADQEEKDAAMLSKIRGALVYPAIILVVILVVLVFMMVTIVPQVRSLYEDMGEELPALTQFLVDVTDFFAATWWALLIVLVVVVAGAFYFFKRTPSGRKALDSFKIHVPVFGKLYRKLYVSRFARTAEMMLATGVPMIDSVEIATKATSNLAVEEEYGKAVEIVKSGKPLSEALKDRNYMLPLVPQMASIGEESGKVDEMLGKAAAVYENELDNQINTISTMIEPILMVAMAGLIGIVIGGTLMPIYSLVNSIAN